MQACAHSLDLRMVFKIIKTSTCLCRARVQARKYQLQQAVAHCSQQTRHRASCLLKHGFKVWQSRTQLLVLGRHKADQKAASGRQQKLARIMAQWR